MTILVSYNTDAQKRRIEGIDGLGNGFENNRCTFYQTPYLEYTSKFNNGVILNEVSLIGDCSFSFNDEEGIPHDRCDKVLKDNNLDIIYIVESSEFGSLFTLTK